MKLLMEVSIMETRRSRWPRDLASLGSSCQHKCAAETLGANGAGSNSGIGNRASANPQVAGNRVIRERRTRRNLRGLTTQTGKC